MVIKENSFLYKLKEKLVPFLTLVLIAALIWVAFGSKIPGLIPLLREGDGEKIAAYLAQETGIKGMIAVMILQGVQVASVVLPGMAIQVAAGLLYGWPIGTVLCYIGFVVANWLVFAFARRVGSDKLRTVSMGKWSQWFMEKLQSTPPMFMVAIANMVPAIPNGIIPYIAAKTKITTKEYVLSVASVCWIQIMTSCMAGQFIIRGQWLFTAIAIAVQCLVIVLALWQKDWIISTFDKRYQTRAIKRANRKAKRDAEVRAREAEKAAQKEAEYRPENVPETRPEKMVGSAAEVVTNNLPGSVTESGPDNVTKCISENVSVSLPGNLPGNVMTTSPEKVTMSMTGQWERR